MLQSKGRKFLLRASLYKKASLIHEAETSRPASTETTQYLQRIASVCGWYEMIQQNTENGQPILVWLTPR